MSSLIILVVCVLVGLRPSRLLSDHNALNFLSQCKEKFWMTIHFSRIQFLEPIEAVKAITGPGEWLVHSLINQVEKEP